jgi:periplasmic copper chaperone A
MHAWMLDRPRVVGIALAITLLTLSVATACVRAPDDGAGEPAPSSAGTGGSATGSDAPGPGVVTIADAWVRAGTAGRPTAAYMVIRNVGTVADRLVGVHTDAAPEAQVHESRMEGAEMKMVHLEAGLEIPPGGKVLLKPQGYHIMLLEAARDLKEGDTVSLTLSFERAGDVTVSAPVLPVASMGLTPTG